MYLMIKSKSLAAEARIIRHAELRAKKEGRRSLRQGLYYHRIEIVRPEARATNLAYGFLRGRKLREIEQRWHPHRKRPDWTVVQSMIERYCEGDKRDAVQKFAEWKEAA